MCAKGNFFASRSFLISKGSFPLRRDNRANQTNRLPSVCVFVFRVSYVSFALSVWFIKQLLSVDTASQPIVHICVFWAHYDVMNANHLFCQSLAGSVNARILLLCKGWNLNLGNLHRL